jgi:hypothetical protein
LINVQSLKSAAFSFSLHPGATGWQLCHGKLPRNRAFHGILTTPGAKSPSFYDFPGAPRAL